MSPLEKVKVRTTLPFPVPPIAARRELQTARLIIRAPQPSDLAALHTLRTQPEVMIFSSEGRIDRNLEETRKNLETSLPPNDSSTYDFLLFNKETGDLIGTGGVHRLSHWFGWPEVGYCLKHEAWGQGYATEFLTAFLENWWSLPRTEAELEVNAKSIGETTQASSNNVVNECLTAMVEKDHVPSRRVLEKSGFRLFDEWNELDDREGFDSREIGLTGYGISSPSPERGISLGKT